MNLESYLKTSKKTLVGGVRLAITLNPNHLFLNILHSLYLYIAHNTYTQITNIQKMFPVPFQLKTS